MQASQLATASTIHLIGKESPRVILSERGCCVYFRKTSPNALVMGLEVRLVFIADECYSSQLSPSNRRKASMLFSILAIWVGIRV